MKPRARKKLAIIGGTNTGKSTRAEKIAIVRKIKFGEPIIIYDRNRQIKWQGYPEITIEQLKRMKKGMYRINTSNAQEFFKVINDYFKGGVVIGEDLTAELSPQVDENILGIITGLRHQDHDVDIVFITHSVKRIPKYVLEQLDELILYKTGDAWDDIKGRIPERIKEEFKQKFLEVNNDPGPHASQRIIITQTTYA